MTHDHRTRPVNLDTVHPLVRAGSVSGLTMRQLDPICRYYGSRVIVGLVVVVGVMFLGRFCAKRRGLIWPICGSVCNGQTLGRTPTTAKPHGLDSVYNYDVVGVLTVRYLSLYAARAKHSRTVSHNEKNQV